MICNTARLSDKRLSNTRPLQANPAPQPKYGCTSSDLLLAARLIVWVPLKHVTITLRVVAAAVIESLELPARPL